MSRMNCAAPKVLKCCFISTSVHRRSFNLSRASRQIRRNTAVLVAPARKSRFRFRIYRVSVALQKKKEARHVLTRSGSSSSAVIPS